MSAFHKLNRFMASAMTKATQMPVRPPIAAPNATNITVSRSSSIAVLA